MCNINILPPGTDIVLETYVLGSAEYIRLTSEYGEHFLFSNWFLGGNTSTSWCAGYTSQLVNSINVWSVNGLIDPARQVERELKQRNFMLTTNNVV